MRPSPLQEVSPPRGERALLAELESWSAFGAPSEVDDYGGVPVFTNEFWTAKQRVAHSLHEISYRACFKAQLPEFFISRLSAPGELVFDPFMGRGTTLLEAALAHRDVAGNDVNPLSSMLLAPRLDPPELAEVEERLAGLDLGGAVDAPEGFDAFFEARTLAQICSLRAYLLARQADGALDPIDAWIRMVAINRLTGHSPGFFSVYTLPPNQAASIESQRRINARRDQRPEHRDVKAIVARKSRALMRDLATRRPGGRLRRLFRQSVSAPFELEGAPVSLSVTSPPFLDTVDYRKDNWMRCWFAGIDPAEIGISQSPRMEDWRAMVLDALVHTAAVTAPGGFFAFEVGEVRKGALRLEETVIDLARQTGCWRPVCAMVNRQAFTKTSNTWGIANNRGGTNSNRIALLRKSG